MLIFRLLAILSCFHLLVVSAHALQNPPYTVSLNEVIHAVENPFRIDRNGFPALDNVQADFFQRSTIVEKNREFRADGEMYFKPASSREALKFRFDYFRPTRHEIVCNGSTLWIYLPENRQVILSDVAEFFAPARYDRDRERSVNFLQGLGRISKDFTIIFNRPMTDQVGNYILELTPVRASATIEKLFITVDRESVHGPTGTRPPVNTPAGRPPESHIFPILATTVVDHDGNSTTIEFSNIRANGMLSDMMFSFNPPADALVVRPPARR